MFVARFDSWAAQNCLHDEMDLHGFPLFHMHWIDPSHHTAHQGSADGMLGRGDSRSRSSKSVTWSFNGLV